MENENTTNSEIVDEVNSEAVIVGNEPEQEKASEVLPVEVVTENEVSVIAEPQAIPEKGIENIPVVTPESVPVVEANTQPIVNIEHDPAFPLMNNNEVSEQKYEAQQPEVKSKPNMKELWVKFLDKIAGRKKSRLEKIMIFITTKKHKISNDDVEKLLHVSDATATRYLSELVKGGHLKKNKGGKWVSYERS